MTELVSNIDKAVNAIRQQISSNIDLGLVLGSGLSEIQFDGFQSAACLNYQDIDGLPASTAPSHSGTLHFLTNSTLNIAVCAGRHHLYEGYTPQHVATLSYVLNQLGAKKIIITNAAGALNEQYQPGDVMLINDHINFTGHNPLVGEFLNERQNSQSAYDYPFTDMSNAYDSDFLEQAKQAASEVNIECHQGIYAGVLGPSLETSAERRMLKVLGGDAVGMSTVMEVIAANHCGMRVLGLSAITNMATGGVNQQADTIEDVLANAKIAGDKIKKLLQQLLKHL